MKHLNDSAAKEEILGRLNKLSPSSKPLWGKMSVAQMLDHCARTIEVPLRLRNPKKNLFAVLFGRYIKKVIVEEKEFKQNLPTSPNFIPGKDPDFDKSKKLLVEHIQNFSKLSLDELETRRHPVGGHFTGHEWAWSQYKHLDHHLKQFGT